GDYAIGVMGELIYVMGGHTGTIDVNLVQIYNTLTDTWTYGTQIPGISTSRLQGGIVGNKIVITGGYSHQLSTLQKQTRVGTIDESNPLLIDWSVGPDFPYARERHGGT